MQLSRGNLAARFVEQLYPGQFSPNGPLFHFTSRASRIPASLTLGKSDMQRMTVVAMAAMLVAGPAFAQGAGSAAGSPPAPHPAAAAGTAPAAHAAAAKPAVAASTPESRSAAALALSHEPTYDESSAQRIREAALSYSDIAVRGGWPMIPAEAKFALGTPGPHDDLLRQRLLLSDDLAADKTSRPFDADVA